MIDRETKIQCMRFLFARPSSLHEDPDRLVTWTPEGMPRIFRGRAEEVVTNDDLLVSLYDELLAREQKAGAEPEAE
jgi:hypothetical protein